MHLVDVGMFFAPEGGGVSRYLAVKSAWLRLHTRWRHTIIAPAPSDWRHGGVQMFRSPLRIQHFRFPLRSAHWTRRIVASGPDLIEAGDPYVLAWACLAAAGRLSVPAVALYHSDVVGTTALRAGRAAGIAAARYARALYSQFDLVIAPSRYVQNRLRNWGIERVACQGFGVDVQVFHPDRRTSALRTQLGLAPDAKLLVFAGRFTREKNIGVLCNAVGRLGHPYHLLLIGSGALPALPRNATVLPFERDDKKLAAMLASCDAFVHAGDRETFGLVVLEAMACALPLVVARGGALAELVEGHGTVVDRLDGAHFAESISAAFASDPIEIGRQARRWVEMNCTWDHALRGLFGLYTQVHGRAAAAANGVYAAR